MPVEASFGETPDPTLHLMYATCVCVEEEKKITGQTGRLQKPIQMYELTLTYKSTKTLKNLQKLTQPNFFYFSW